MFIRLLDSKTLLSFKASKVFRLEYILLDVRAI